MNNIKDLIPCGKENAVSRDMLSTLSGVPDRQMRKLIENARNAGEIILCDQDGAGYYISDDMGEMARYYRQERRRALAVLRRLKAIRRKLKEAGML